ncbi:MAG: hypothetical protein IAE97_05485 [Chthoniobacterales bacterium]|nr:hypothetical protein [Chthoniobacterales bacterium]
MKERPSVEDTCGVIAMGIRFAPSLAGGLFHHMNPKKSFYVREVCVTYKPRRVKITPKLDACLNSSYKVFELFKEMGNEMREKLVAVALSTRHKVLCYEVISIGTVNESFAKPVEIFRNTLHLNPYGYILIHNHPSGDPWPSEADNNLTRVLREVADLLNVCFLDHVIVGAEGYFSYLDHNWTVPAVRKKAA